MLLELRNQADLSACHNKNPTRKALSPLWHKQTERPTVFSSSSPSFPLSSLSDCNSSIVAAGCAVGSRKVTVGPEANIPPVRRSILLPAPLSSFLLFFSGVGGGGGAFGGVRSQDRSGMQSHEVVHVHSRSLLYRSLLSKYVPHPRSLKAWDSAGRFAGGLWRANRRACQR